MINFFKIAAAMFSNGREEDDMQLTMVIPGTLKHVNQSQQINHHHNNNNNNNNNFMNNTNNTSAKPPLPLQTRSLSGSTSTSISQPFAPKSSLIGNLKQQSIPTQISTTTTTTSVQSQISRPSLSRQSISQDATTSFTIQTRQNFQEFSDAFNDPLLSDQGAP